MIKRYLFLILLLIPCLANAGVNVGVAGGGAASCQASPFLTNVPTTDNNNNVCDIADHTYMGQTLNPGANKCVCKIDLQLSKVGGSITGKTYTVRIFTLNGTALDAELGASAGVTGVNEWSKTTVSFSFSSCVNVSSGTTYGITISQNNIDDGNFVYIWDYSAGGIASGVSSRWGADKALTGTNVGYDAFISLYAYE